MRKNHFKVNKTSVFALLGMAALSACGGSSGSSGEDFVDDLNNSIAAFEEDFLDEDFFVSEFTDIDNLPTADVEYEGFIFVTRPLEAEQVVGRANLDADFVANTITMSTSDYNLFDTSSPIGTIDLIGETTGDLSMTDGVISEDFFGTGVFDGTVTGTVDGQAINTALSGDFVGANGEGIIGGGSQGSTEIGLFATSN